MSNASGREPFPLNFFLLFAVTMTVKDPARPVNDDAFMVSLQYAKSTRQLEEEYASRVGTSKPGMAKLSPRVGSYTGLSELDQLGYQYSLRVA